MNLRKDHYRSRSLGLHAGASPVRGGILLKLLPGPRGGRGARAHPLPRISGGGRADSGPGRFGEATAGAGSYPFFAPHPFNAGLATDSAGGRWGRWGGSARLSDGVPVSLEARLPRPAGVIHCRSRAPAHAGPAARGRGRILPTLPPSPGLPLSRSPGRPLSELFVLSRARCFGPRALHPRAASGYPTLPPPPETGGGFNVSGVHTGPGSGWTWERPEVAFVVSEPRLGTKGLPQTKNKCTTLSGGSLGSCVDEERS